MASQELFPFDSQLDNSEIISFSQIDSFSDCEKPMSDGMEEFLNQTMRQEDGINVQEFTTVYCDQGGLKGTTWTLSQTPNEFTQDYSCQVLTGAGAIPNPLLIGDLPSNFDFDGGQPLKAFELQQGLSLSQSSTSSLDDGIPSMESWQGEYNFAFSLEPGPTRKFQFSTANNKLFCLPQQEIEFFFTYDFEKCKATDMHMTAFLRYTKPDCAAIPVLRCVTHELDDRNKLDQQSRADPEVSKLVGHVLKCTHKKAEYRQDSKTQRCSVKVPIGRPQPGISKISRLFKFDCLNSCKPQKINKKSPVAVVFELYERSTVVGRIAFNVRVCSCPGRDFMKEEPQIINGVPVVCKKRKSAEMNQVKVETLQQVDGSTRRSGEQKRSRKWETEDDAEDLDNIAKSRRTSEPAVLLTPKVEFPPINPEIDPFLSSSQESHVSDDDLKDTLSQTKLERYKEIQRMAKWVLRLGYNENPILSQLGKNFARSVRQQTKLAYMVLESINKNKPSGELRNEVVAGGSPDSGINAREESNF